MENVTDNPIAGIPQGAICVNEGAYSPSGLMQNFCDKLDKINDAIPEGRYATPVTADNINFKIRLTDPRLSRRGQGSTNAETITIVSNPDYNSNDSSSPTHHIIGNPKVPIILSCEKNEDGSFVANEQITDAWKKIMTEITNRMTRIEKNSNNRRTVGDVPYDILVTYTGNKEINKTTRDLIIRMKDGGVIIRRYSNIQAPSLFNQN